MRAAIVWATWIAMLTALVFTGAFGLQPFYDDWVIPAAAVDALRTLSSPSFIASPIGRHWSPGWNALAILFVRLAPVESDLPVRALTLILFVFGLAWFVRVARAATCSTAAILAGLAILALHHARAAALYSFDTYTQTIADLATWVAGGLALIAVLERRPLAGWRLAAAIGLPFIAVVFKEQALAGAAVVAAMAMLNPDSRRVAARTIATVTAGVVLFAAARHGAGARFDAAGEYSLCVSCVPRNAAALLGSTLLPVRTLDVADAWRAGALGWLVVLALVALGLLVCASAALVRRSRRGGTVLPLIVALLASLFPVVLLGKVGELHAQTLVFWLALLAAVSVDEWLSPRSSPAARMPIALLAVVYVVSLAVGLRTNLADMRATGEAARHWRERLTAAAAALPDGAIVVVPGPMPVRAPQDYSLYRLTPPEFTVFMWLWAIPDAVTPGVQVLYGWNADDRVRIARARMEGQPLYEVRRTATEVTVRRIEPEP